MVLAIPEAQDVAEPASVHPSPRHPLVLQPISDPGRLGRLLHGKFTYSAVPDDDVFEWDVDTLEAVSQTSTSEMQGLRGKSRRIYLIDVATKKSLVKARRVEAWLVGLGRAEDAAALRERLPPFVREVETRSVRNESVETRLLAAMSILVMLAIVVLPTLVVSVWTGTRHGWVFLAMAYAQLAVFSTALLPLLWVVDKDLQPPGRGARWYSTTGWRFIGGTASLLITSICLGAAVDVLVNYHHREPALWLEVLAASGVAMTLYIVAAALIGGIAMLVSRWPAKVDPMGVLLVDWVLLVVSAMEWEDSELKQSRFLRDLEKAAEHAERLFPRLVRRRSRLRGWSVRRGKRIGAIIRRHAEWALELPPAGRCKMAASLLNGLSLLLQGEWDSLLTVEPEGFTRTFFRRYLPRIALSLLLASLALLLPAVLGEQINDPATFQASLLVAAGFSLIAPNVQEAAKVARSFRGGGEK